MSKGYINTNKLRGTRRENKVKEGKGELGGANGSS